MSQPVVQYLVELYPPGNTMPSSSYRPAATAIEIRRTVFAPVTVEQWWSCP